MSDAAWKAFERAVARTLGGRRFWANAGERLDVETLHYVVQCKLVRALSLEALTQLAEEVERLGHQAGKIGIVAVKVRRGAGRRSPVLYVQTEAMWRAQHGEGTG